MIIAAGTETRLLPGTSLSDRVVTYEEHIMTRDLPRSVIIAGAGAIGVEFAYVMANYGVDVTIVEYLDRLLPLEDAEVSKELAKHYRKLGVTVLTSTKVESIDDSGDQVTVRVSDAAGGERELTADKVVQAIGFAPRTEATASTRSVSSSPSAAPSPSTTHAHQRRPRLRDRRRHRQADAGPRRGGPGVVAAETIAGAETVELEYVMMPRATFCQPQVASFGYTEAQARELADEKAGRSSSPSSRSPRTARRRAWATRPGSSS